MAGHKAYYDEMISNGIADTGGPKKYAAAAGLKVCSLNENPVTETSSWL